MSGFWSLGLLLLVVCAANIASTDAIFFKTGLDCLVSEWTPWSQPYGFGQISRERKVLRHPTKGGEDCPQNLTDIQYTGMMFLRFCLIL